MISDFRGQRANCLKYDIGLTASQRLPQSFQIDLLLDSLPDVPGGLPVPHHIGDISRRMIERRHANARIMRRRDKRVARTEARAHDAELRVALLLQPVKAAANVDHSLPHRIERAPDIGGHGIVGAR